LVCRAAAVLVLAALLATPGAGAQGASMFTVSVTPTAAAPGDDVTLSFTALDENLVLLGCGAALEGRPLPDCTGSGRAWSLHFTVPLDAKPVTTTIAWHLTYYSVPDSHLGAVPREGSVDFTVLSPEVLPDVSVVLDPASGRRGDAVTARFTPIDPTTTITTCSVVIAGTTFSSCTISGTGWALPFTVPGGADVGSSTVDWSAVVERDDETRDASGSTPFTVLPPDDRSPTFSVTVSPDASSAKGSVTLRFSGDDATVSITGCAAQLEGVPLPACVGSGTAWSIPFTVPEDITAGPHPITWQLTYAREGLVLDPSSVVPDATAKGTVSITVLPPVTTSSPPPDTSTTTAGTVKKGATSNRGTSGGTGSAGGTRAGGSGVEPPVAGPPETTPASWVREHFDLGLLLALIALAALAGILLGSRGRPVRSSSPARSVRPPLDGQVRAVAHPGPLPTVVLHDTTDGRRSRTVRLSAQCPPASSHLKEVTS
jgi:hypothetical protein